MRAMLASAISTAHAVALKAAKSFLADAAATLQSAEEAGTARRSQPTRAEECNVATLVKSALEATPFDHESREVVQTAFDRSWDIITK